MRTSLASLRDCRRLAAIVAPARFLPHQDEGRGIFVEEKMEKVHAIEQMEASFGQSVRKVIQDLADVAEESNAATAEAKMLWLDEDEETDASWEPVVTFGVKRVN